MHGNSALNRIVSLDPTATDIFCALGFESRLIGRSHLCGNSLIVSKLPVLTSPLLGSDGMISDVDLQAIERIQPDLVVMPAGSRASPPPSWNTETKIISFNWITMEDGWSAMRTLAEMLSASSLAEEKLTNYRNRMNVIKMRAAGLHPHPTAATLIWIDPLMAAGNWVPDCVAMAGGKNLFGDANRPALSIRYEQLIEANPDFILIFACGLDIPRMRDDLTPFSVKPGWLDLRAVQNNRVFLIDGRRYLNRPGPRLVESLEILAETLHPEEFDFGHRNDGWEYWGFDRI